MLEYTLSDGIITQVYEDIAAAEEGAEEWYMNMSQITALDFSSTISLADKYVTKRTTLNSLQKWIEVIEDCIGNIIGERNFGSLQVQLSLAQ